MQAVGYRWSAGSHRPSRGRWGPRMHAAQAKWGRHVRGMRRGHASAPQRLQRAIHIRPSHPRRDAEDDTLFSRSVVCIVAHTDKRLHPLAVCPGFAIPTVNLKPYERGAPATLPTRQLSPLTSTSVSAHERGLGSCHPGGGPEASCAPAGACGSPDTAMNDCLARCASV